MDATPTICPACGELIIAWPTPDGRALLYPIHPDRVMPDAACAADAPLPAPRWLPLS